MGLEINANQPVGGVNSNFFINPIQQQRNYIPKAVELGSNPDAIQTNTDTSKYGNEKAVLNMIKANPEIIKILNDSKIPVKVNMKILDDLNKNHLPETKKTVLGIVNKLPQDFKSAVNLPALQKAAVLHDYGKILIPEKILYKKGNLNEHEHKIMEKHSNLGYEMLKTTDLDKETLELIKNHHQNAKKTGYPDLEGNFVADINNQILTAADIYTALKEKRSYKPELTKNQALAVIHKEMTDGNIHPYVFKALVDYANQQEQSTKINPQRQILNLQPVNSLSA